MEKAIEIKRRAQRCILNGDLDGALAEYEKLVVSGDSDPYYWVLLADLLYKKGNASDAQRRYLEAIDGYEKNGLFKNGIAVCKKMSRLSLAPLEVTGRLANLYARDGFTTEAVLSYQQWGELLVKQDRLEDARGALEKAIALNAEGGRTHDRLAEIAVLLDDPYGADQAWAEAADRYERTGQVAEAERCRKRLVTLREKGVPPAPKDDPRRAAAASSATEVAEASEVEAPVASLDPASLGGFMVTPPGLERDGDAPPAMALDLPESAAIEIVSAADALDGEAEEGRASAPSLSLAGLDAMDYALELDSAATDEAPSEPARPSPPGRDDQGAFAIDDDAELTPEEALAIASDGAPEAPDAPTYEENEELPALEASHASEAPMYEATSYDEAVADDEAAGVVTDDAGAPLDEAVSFVDAASLDDGVPADYRMSDAEADAAPPLGPLAPQTLAPAEPALVSETPAPPVSETLAPLVSETLAPLVSETLAPLAANAVARGEEAPRAASMAIERFGDDSSPAKPGLAFGSGAAGDGDARAPESAPTQEDSGLAEVSMILAEAQTSFHAGDRDAATMALMRAAQAYDQLGRYDSAAAIYRSLGHSPDVSLQLMMLWLKNCQRRDDRAEAARVACDLGDRALNDGDVPGARDWFERARSYDPSNEIAGRRLQHLDTAPQGGGVATLAPDAEVLPLDARTATGDGFVHVRTDRDEPVAVELGALIEEFRRAIAPELASDPQGNYDLAMSYREMGLVDEAVESFRRAAEAPEFRLRAGEFAGRCLLDLGRFDEAADALRLALTAPDVRPSAVVDLRYQLGLALEAAGRSSEALEAFEQVYAAQASFADVAMKIRVLRKSSEAA